MCNYGFSHGNSFVRMQTLFSRVTAVQHIHLVSDSETFILRKHCYPFFANGNLGGEMIEIRGASRELKAGVNVKAVLRLLQ